MEMPEIVTLYKVELEDGLGRLLILSPPECQFISCKYHHDRILKAKDAEILELRKEVAELSTQKQGLIGISDGKSNIIKSLESRIALLETFIESRGYDVPV